MNSYISEVEIFYNNPVKIEDRKKVISSRSAQEAFFDFSDPRKIGHKEFFWLMLLNNSNHILGISTLSSGGITGTIVDVRLLFQIALKANATAIIVGHNHPSGKTEPSNADKQITNKIKSAGDFLDIKLLDHIIITPENTFYSFADEGQI
ncbi:RadC-like JAB domain-containing protein [Pustulibacterium marinum]|uniref:RadC-like JAB domain-containing protein n=1 Tax=Pustulibacterium marinum TaxID=1224947 RepID=A0A1I7GKU9_9FLAO|nr:JAB domain-containing protein [Pustulibacterium marinum]SFU49063.1 RadC-like JAB domain-containing protein [Pustulibacterium marinum]